MQFSLVGRILCGWVGAFNSLDNGFWQKIAGCCVQHTLLSAIKSLHFPGSGQQSPGHLTGYIFVFGMKLLKQVLDIWGIWRDA